MCVHINTISEKLVTFVVSSFLPVEQAATHVPCSSFERPTLAAQHLQLAPPHPHQPPKDGWSGPTHRTERPGGAAADTDNQTTG